MADGRQRVERRAMTLRETFEEAPELYDRVRPDYPEELFDDLARLVGLVAGSRVLELGCGTGQATVSLARRGYSVVAVELGAGLAGVARRKLAPFPAVRVVNAAFEAWPLPAEPFDVVFAATSFHWIDRAIRVTKSADALRPGGALAVVSTHHVAGGDEQFFADAQRCYERWDPETPAGLRLPAAADVPSEREEFEASERVSHMVFRRYERELTYSASEYRDLLLTYSGHRAMEPDAQRGLLSCLVRLIDERYGGRIAKRYMNELAVAYVS
jgi:SAM-dependent methyltransferase